MDGTPLERDLLLHRDFLLRLAAGLVGRNDAEDLVQEVWAKSLVFPPPTGANARAWLARVARNLASNRFRARGRREARERARGIPEAEEVTAVGEHFELTQRVAAAVGALEEPYRSVILLRFFEGLEHARIAETLGVSIATVRTRQQRALARLRERMDREQGGREAWSLALGAWLVRQGVPVGTGVAGTSVLVAAAAVVALVTGWFVLRGAPAAELETPRIASETGASTDSLSPEPVSEAVSAAREPAAAVASVEAQAAAGHRLVGRILGLSAAECAATRITVDADWPYQIDPPTLDGIPDADGRFTIALDPVIAFGQGYQGIGDPEALVVRVDQPLHLVHELRVDFAAGAREPDGGTRHDAGEVSLVAAAVLRGTLRTEGGDAAVGAEVEAFSWETDEPATQGTGLTTVDADGHYELRLDHGGELVLAFLAANERPAHRRVDALLGQVLELGETVLPAGEALGGRVVRLGQPMPGARVSVSLRESGWMVERAGAEITWIDGRFEWERLFLDADAAGSFRQDGLAAREYQMSVLSPSSMTGSLAMRTEVEDVRAPALDLTLEFRAALVTLRRAADAPAELPGRIHVAHLGQPVASFWLWRASDAEATTFVAPPETPLTLSVELEGLPPLVLEIVTGGPGEELERTLSFGTPSEGATLELALVPDPRLALEELHVAFESPDGRPRFSRSVPIEDVATGLVRLTDLPAGPHRIRVHAGYDPTVRTVAFERVLEIELVPGETRRLPVAFELGGLLHVDVRDPDGVRREVGVRLLDAAGQPVEITFHAKGGNTDFSNRWKLPAWSTNESEVLPAGTYELVLTRDGFEDERLPVRLVAGEVTTLAVTLRPR